MPFFSKKVDAREYAKIQKLSLEESARNLRYQFFEKILTETDYNLLATAHTADDQAETVLDRFLRGSGFLGMSGIPPKRAAYIRPLLEISRSQLEKYVEQNGLEYRVDASNQDLRFKRNRIRNELIPYLRKHFNPNIVDTINRNAQIFSENETVLKNDAETAFKSLVSLQKKNEITLEIESFLNYFSAIQKYILYHVCEKLGIHRNALTFDKFVRLLAIVDKKKIGKKVDIDKNYELMVDHDGIIIRRKRKSPHKIVKIDLLQSKPIKYNDFELSWSVLDRGTLNFTRDRKTEYVDFGRTGSQLFLRTFKPGDKFIPLNFSGHKKIADFFSDRKVPHHLREVAAILESPEGVVWICGYCIDDRFKVTKETRRLLKLELHDNRNGP